MVQFVSRDHPMPHTVELKFAWMEIGEPFVMTFGMTEMLVLYADSLDLLHTVYMYISIAVIQIMDDVCVAEFLCSNQ